MTLKLPLKEQSRIDFQGNIGDSRFRLQDKKPNSERAAAVTVPFIERILNNRLP
jgi:hypothetical protein